jgi:hypothetical protein
VVQSRQRFESYPQAICVFLKDRDILISRRNFGFAFFMISGYVPGPGGDLYVGILCPLYFIKPNLLPMKFSLQAVFSLFFLVILAFSCSKDPEEPANPCAGVTVGVTANVTNTATGQSNGSIVASATGGSGFTFSINNGAFQSTGTFNNLAAGTYTVTAKNSNGCTGSAQFTVATNGPCVGVTVTVTGNVTDASSGQSNGSIVASATGGSGFTYSINSGAFQSSSTFSNLAAGTYTITAKNSDGCTGSAQFTVGTINPCTGVTVTVTATVTNATTGQSNGSIVASATGGSGFTFSLNSGAFQASGTFNNLAAGTYTVTAKNSNGCTGSAQFTVGTTNPCSGVTIVVTGSTTNATTGQSNGSITASASGSTGFTYSLNATNYQASGTFNNLAAGTYTVTAKDLNGCTGSAQFVVGTTNPCAGITIVVNGTTTNATTGQSNGSISATATGSTGFTFSINGTTFQASGTFNNLAAGSYTVTAKDLNGCTGTKQFTVGSTNPCSGITITVTGTSTGVIPCSSGNNGSITASASGSTGFTYSINGTTFQASNFFSNLASGNYTITAKDLNGCTGTSGAINVGTAPIGPLFLEVKTIIQANCAVSGCHDASTQQNGINFSNQCHIIDNKDRIKVRAVDGAGTPNQMPPPPRPSLTASERQKITDWINAGGGYNN